MNKECPAHFPLLDVNESEWSEQFTSWQDTVNKPFTNRSIIMAKPSKEKAAEPTSKVRLRVFSQQSSTIFRTDLPSINDKTENAVLWLVKNNFKPEEIEIIGEKPSTWDSAFNINTEVIAPEVVVAETQTV